MKKQLAILSTAFTLTISMSYAMNVDFTQLVRGTALNKTATDAKSAVAKNEIETKAENKTVDNIVSQENVVADTKELKTDINKAYSNSKKNTKKELNRAKKTYDKTQIDAQKEMDELKSHNIKSNNNAQSLPQKPMSKPQDKIHRFDGSKSCQ